MTLQGPTLIKRARVAQRPIELERAIHEWGPTKEKRAIVDERPKAAERAT